MPANAHQQAALALVGVKARLLARQRQRRKLKPVLCGDDGLGHRCRQRLAAACCRAAATRLAAALICRPLLFLCPCLCPSGSSRSLLLATTVAAAAVAVDAAALLPQHVCSLPPHHAAQPAVLLQAGGDALAVPLHPGRCSGWQRRGDDEHIAQRAQFVACRVGVGVSSFASGSSRPTRGGHHQVVAQHIHNQPGQAVALAVDEAEHRGGRCRCCC